MTTEKIQELHDFLTGAELPEGAIAKSPKLTPKSAMTVIWFLQEISGVIPSRFEMCGRCKSMYDSEVEGIYLEKGRVNHICRRCITDSDYRKYQKEIGL